MAAWLHSPAAAVPHLWRGVVWQEVGELRQQVIVVPEQHSNLQAAPNKKEAFGIASVSAGSVQIIHEYS